MDSRSHTASAGPAPRAAAADADTDADIGNDVNPSTNASAESSQPETPASGDRGRRGISLMGIRSGSKRTPSTSTTDLHETPTGRRAVAGNGGLGLRAPSVHTAENASVYSGRSVAESISGDSKPSSQKSSGMGFVRRLRRLSTAAISSKVNRLFSRSGNPSQDSLLMSGPSSPTSAYMSPGTMPRSPTMPAGSESADGYRTKHMHSYAMSESLSAQSSSFHSPEWRTANAPALPPLPPKPLNARRNRAMTEISPLVVVRGHLNTDEAESPEGSGDSMTHKLAQTRAKAVNSPLVASPLSRKSFHTLNVRTSCDEDMEAEESRAQNMAKSASDNLLALAERTVPRPPPPFGRGVSPKMSRSSSSTTTETYRPPTLPHRLSYQQINNTTAGAIDSDGTHQVSDTPSPPERRGGRSQAYLTGDSRTPTVQRRRTALATLNWLERSDGSESGPVQDRDYRLSSTLLLSSGPSGGNSNVSINSNGGNGSALRRQASSNAGGTDSPSGILAAFQLRSRVGTGLFRKPSPGTSARSSTSITSDSMQSWASAIAGGDMELEDENDTAMPHNQDSMLSIAASSRNGGGGAISASDAGSSAYPPLPTFDKSIADWQQRSQDDTPTLYRHLQFLSGARSSGPSSTNPFDTPARKPSRDSVLQMRAKGPLKLGSNADHAADAGLDSDSHDDAASDTEADADAAADADVSGQATPQRRASTAVGDEPLSANSTVSNASATPSVLGYPSSQPIRSRGGSQTVHLARAATTNAIRLKGKGAAVAGDSTVSGGIGIALSPSNVVTDRRAAHGSAPEPSNIDLAVERGVLRPRVRATSASNQQFGPNSDPIPGTYDGSGYGASSVTGQPQSNALGRSSGFGTLASIPVSRPPSSMSAYTMSPVSSTMGDETNQIPILGHGHLPSTHMWPNSLAYKSSPDRSSVSDAQMSLTMHSAGAHTPTSTSSPPAHHYIHGHSHQSQHHHHHSSTGSISGSGQGSHQLRLNTSSVQRSASGHSVSSGISELLEPSSVSQVRKDALWQILVVSKSRADTEIDKMMRHWKETENGMIVCTQDADAKPAVGDEDAIILKVKRGHRRSTSDIKRSDGDRNEFRRRVVELAHLIRHTSVSELSNDVITRNITEQLYGLLTEHRARFVSDTHIGTLIVDMLYQFSAVSQTVSQLAMPMALFSGMRGGMSGDASPAVSQFPSPQLAPESSLARGGLSLLPSLTSALSSQYESASARSSAAAATRGRDGLDALVSAPADSLGMPISASRAQTAGSVTGVSDLSEYRMGPAASEISYQSGSVSGRMRPHDSASYVSSPRMLPATAHSSTASLLSLLAPVNSSGNNSVSGSFGRSVGGSTHQHQPHQRSRMYFPTTSTTPHSNRLSVDLADSESESSARPSLDESQARPSLNRHASKLSISSDAPDNQTFSHKKALRASIQPHHLFNHFARIQQQQQAQVPSSPQSQLSQQEQRFQAKQQALAQLESGSDDAIHPAKTTRISRPATMFIPGGSRQGMFRRVSESASRHEKLAKLLNQDIDSSDSMPNSPAEPSGAPGCMSSETDPIAVLSQPPSASLGTIPEIQRGSGPGSQEPSIHRPSFAVDDNTSTEANVDGEDAEAEPGSKSARSHASTHSNKLAVSPQGSITSLVLQQTHSRSEVKSPAASQAEISPCDVDVENASEAVADEESVVCRICERSFHRSVLNLHSDVCMLEQTRAMKLDEANHRIKRLRDSVSKRLADLKKARQWDRIAIRESERVIRIAERAAVWPEGDSQHELIVAKSKFAKYIEKLETITGAAASSTSPIVTDDQNKTALVSSVAAASKLPRADVETIWLAKQLLARIQDKCTIIEEFDKEFSRLERQEALIRQAESTGAEAESDSEPMHAANRFQELPTWSQLAQHTGQRSPAASERTSMDFAPSQSESGSATPDVAGSFALGIAKGSSVMSRRNSRHSRPSRRSLSRSARLTPDIIDSDAPTTVSGSPVSSANGSGSRKLVSLFAALFRNGGGSGFGRNKDAAGGPSVLRRKNTSSAFSANVLPVMSRSSSAIRRLSQNTPSSQSSASISATSTPTPALVPATPGSSGALSMLAVPSEPGHTASTSATASIPTPADVPLSSPVTRQRNNSQLSSMRATPESAAKVQRMPSIDEFDFIKPISRGAFGRVYLTRKKATKDLYAIKVMRKKDMINKNMVTQALAERRALSLLSTDWVVQLYYAFHSSKHLFLVMEYLVGGDLAGLLRVWGVMEEDAAKFYIAEIACAIDYLHRNSIVHRDIKPDNVILASDGHIKLTDFGLSQVAVRGNAPESNTNIDSPTSEGTPLSDGDAIGRLTDKPEDYWDAALKQAGRSVQTPALAVANAQASKALPVSKRAHARKSTRSFLGTPDYLAPELLLGAGNGLAVDWWALGVCLFEFVCGYPPFTDESPEAIFRNILNHAIDWPDEDGYVSEEAVELINALLHPDPTTRAHWKDIKAAKLFEGWAMSDIRQMEPPFVPQPDDDADTSYFEPCQRSEIQRLSNATFLQMDTPKKPPPTPRQQSARATEVLPLSDSPRESQQGSQRGSHRGRSASGSTSVRNAHGTASSVGQLKKLFAETADPEDGADDSRQQTESETVDNEAPSTAGSIISSSSSDNYSFTNVDSASADVGVQSSPKTVIPFAALPAAAAGEESDAELVLTPLRRRSSSSSINSLSEPEIEPIPARRISSLAVSAAQLADSSGPLSPASRLPPPLPINHAKRVMGCLPILTDSNSESGSSSPSTKSHSRCASINIVLAGNKKGGVGARSRRPSDGPDNASEPEITAPLVRSSSTDERLQNINVGGSGTAMAPNAGDSVSASENDSIADDSGKDEHDEDPERVFEDFSYKNLALLSHVNKGVSSSSGNSVPPADKPSFGSSPTEMAPAPASVPTDSPTQFPAAHGSTSVDKAYE
ncbi:hypothetical protein LPJ53_000957 [Coemansia erecta]|uniref:non-specific serine/threonine protein kinase n=1 Tax=Coemansia erecta TaxID=147472 RepID=A0A9W7Y4G1_9FUNG|nr:hypothetical protein LPJ53_000957 [Coemansia erecta]